MGIHYSLFDADQIVLYPFQKKEYATFIKSCLQNPIHNGLGICLKR
ncbi:uncharacterized protein METZ01_LOCUS95083 [marine metagenome]|uniref:Uncharacterized protein n=1 Tax=marine metagenome TaxID=408172 RepID=A0A381VPI5_9ZZZZ